MGKQNRMGGSKSKQQKQPDLQEVLIQMKMKAKMFQRESQKCLKEQKTFYAQAKKALTAGNEEGARLYLESANQKKSESMKYQRVSTRLETLAGKVGANFKSQDMINHLGQITPFLEATAEQLPLEVMNDMMDQLKAELGHEMGIEYIPEQKHKEQVAQNNA